MEAHHLAAGFGDVVVGGDAGGAADDESAIRRGGLLDGLAQDVGAGGDVVVTRRFRVRHGRCRLVRRRARSRLRLGGLTPFRGPRGRSSPPVPGTERGQGRLQLAPARRGEGRVRREDVGEAGQAILGALHQFGLELDEAIDHPGPGHDVDLVQAQLDPRVVRRG